MTAGATLVQQLRPVLTGLPAVHREALHARVEAALPVVLPPGPDAAGTEPLLRLTEACLDRPVDARRAAVLWLALAARLPSDGDVDDLLWALQHAPERAFTPLVEAVEDVGLDTVVHDLLVTPPGTLLVDVTHAVLDPWYLTGIQRVVRGFLSGAGTDVQLVRVADTGRLVAVDAEDFAARLEQGRTPRAAGEVGLRDRVVRRGIDALLLLRRPLADRLARDRAFATRPVVRAGRRAIRELYRHDLGLERTRRDSLVLGDGADLLLVEVRTEPEGVETLLRHRSHLLDRLAVVFHDAIPLTHPQYYAEPHLAGYLRYTRLLRAADVVLPVSEASARTARALRGPAGSRPGPVIAVPLPSAGLVPAAAPGVDQSSDPPVLLCVSSLEPRKNHVRLLRAAGLLRSRGLSFRLVLVAGGSWMTERVEQELDRARAAGLDVELRRGVTDEELSRLYGAARAAVFVSEVEGFGLPVVEALAHGTPVVCTATGSVGEVAAGGGCLTVDPLDVAAIAEALGRVLVDDALHERLVSQAAQRRHSTWLDYASAVRQQVRAAAAARGDQGQEG